jgi:hypothetical protein
MVQMNQLTEGKQSSKVNYDAKEGVPSIRFVVNDFKQVVNGAVSNSCNNSLRIR